MGDVGTGFCTGTVGMVMYMDGFHWSLKGESSCINLYLSSWTLDSWWKFILGMLGVMVLGICTEGVARVRRGVADRARNAASNEHWKYSLHQTGLHGLHALSGYMLMLATMTFSCELMLAVVVGLMIGFYKFGDATLNTSSPCCAFLEGASESPSQGGATNDRAVEPSMPTTNGVGGGDGTCCHVASTVDGGQSTDLGLHV